MIQPAKFAPPPSPPPAPPVPPPQKQMGEIPKIKPLVSDRPPIKTVIMKTEEGEMRAVTVEHRSKVLKKRRGNVKIEPDVVIGLEGVTVPQALPKMANAVAASGVEGQVGVADLGGPSREITLQQPKSEPQPSVMQIDNKLLVSLAAIFYDACPNYLRNLCNGRVMRDDVMEELVDAILNSE